MIMKLHWGYNGQIEGYSFEAMYEVCREVYFRKKVDEKFFVTSILISGVFYNYSSVKCIIVKQLFKIGGKSRDSFYLMSQKFKKTEPVTVIIENWICIIQQNIRNNI